MDERTMSTLLWLVIIFALPVGLTIMSAGFWGDGVGAAGGQPHYTNSAMLFWAVLHTTAWVLLLRYLYLPAVGFDANVMSLAGPFTPRYASLLALQRLVNDFTGWYVRDPVEAGIRTALLVVLLVIPLLAARMLGARYGLRTRGW